MSSGEFKLSNTQSENVLVRLVKGDTASVTFTDAVPFNAVSNSTEVSFNLGGITLKYNNLVLGYSASPNIINASNYITVGNQLTLANNQLTGTININPTDLDYTTRFLGIFFKVTPTDLRYILSKKSTDPTFFSFGVGSRTYNYSVDQILRTAKTYFNDSNYYIPLFLGTLADLNKYIGQTTFVKPLYSQYRGDITLNPTINLVTPVTNVVILNTPITVKAGQTITLTTQVTPSTASIINTTYSSADPKVAIFNDSTQPLLYGVSYGTTKVTVSVTDNLGNTIVTSQTINVVYGA